MLSPRPPRPTAKSKQPLLRELGQAIDASTVSQLLTNSTHSQNINLSSKHQSKHIPHVSHVVLLQPLHPFSTFLALRIQTRAESQQAIEAGVRFSSFLSSRFKTDAPRANCTAFMPCKRLAEVPTCPYSVGRQRSRFVVQAERGLHGDNTSLHIEGVDG